MKQSWKSEQKKKLFHRCADMLTSAKRGPARGFPAGFGAEIGDTELRGSRLSLSACLLSQGCGYGLHETAADGASASGPQRRPARRHRGFNRPDTQTEGFLTSLMTHASFLCSCSQEIVSNQFCRAGIDPPPPSFKRYRWLLSGFPGLQPGFYIQTVSST